MAQEPNNNAVNASPDMEPEYEINLYKVCCTMYMLNTVTLCTMIE